MKTSTIISSLFFVAIVLVLGSCASQNDIATNYYADGIYFDPEYAKALPQTETEQVDTMVIAEEGYDYYEPGTYTSPYEQELPGSGWDNSASFSNWYSPMSMGTSINFCFGNSWGMPYGNDFYSPYGGGGMMYPPYYNPYNPYMMPGGWGYNPYMMSGWGPYNPMWGYPGSYYPPYGGGGNATDYGSFFSGNVPNVIIRGGSNPRPVRNTASLPGRGSGQSIPSKTGRTTRPTIPATTVAANENKQESAKRGSASSRLRTQVEQNQQRSYTSTTYEASQPTDARQQGENKRLYQKTTGREGTAQTTRSTENRAPNTTTPATDGSSNFRRQANRVLNTTAQRTNNSGSGGSNSVRTSTREYTPTRSSGKSSGGSASPSSGGGGSRPSSGSSGGSRPSGGAPTRR